MDGYKLVERFVHVLGQGKRPSSRLVAKIMADEDVPKYVKAKVKRIAAVRQRGGEGDINLTLTKFKCGGGGCVYKIMKQQSNTGVLTNAYSDVLLKLFNFDIKNELKKQFCGNIITVLRNKPALISHTSFTEGPKELFPSTEQISRIVFQSDPHYGYFVEKCTGSIDEQQSFNAGQLTTIRDKIVTMNRLNVVHGDIKFPNILYKTKGEVGIRNSSSIPETEFYLHDFDDVFLLSSTSLDAFSGFNILAPMCTPLYACPVYYIFRNFLHTKSQKQTLEEQIKEYYPYTIKILRGLACMGSTKPREIYNRIKEICNKICNFVLNASDGELNYIAQAVENPAWLRNLIQYSDLYSWGACLIVQSMVATNDGQKQILHNAGELCLINYFQRLKPTSGGRSKKLKKGGNGNGPTAVLPPTTNPNYSFVPLSGQTQPMAAQLPYFDFTVQPSEPVSSIQLTTKDLDTINDTKYQIINFAELVKEIASTQTAEEADDSFYKRHFTKIETVEGPDGMKITLPQ